MNDFKPLISPYKNSVKSRQDRKDILKLKFLQLSISNSFQKQVMLTITSTNYKSISFEKMAM